MAAKGTLLWLALAAPALLLASSAPAADPAAQLAEDAARARAEARAAEQRAEKFERAAASATSQAARLRARQDSAAEGIAAAEARISESSAQARLLAAQLETSRRRLRAAQRPAAALLAGLATMSRRPPLLTLLDERSADELVRVQLLLDATWPAIQARTASLSAAVERARRLKGAIAEARATMVRERRQLETEKRRFAGLEQEALELAAGQGAQALAAGDVALASGEEAGRLARRSQERREAQQLTAELLRLPPAPPRPFEPRQSAAQPAIRYVLPVQAPVTEGLGAVGPSGIRSRGLTLATRKGAAVRVPASGVVRFAGPFRDYDGVVIIDHGGGWVSLLLNVTTAARPGARVERGALLGRALGPLGVELSQNGRRFSPALIAGSSQGL